MRLSTSEENATSSQFEIPLDFLVMEQNFSLAQEIIPDIPDGCWIMFERCRALGCELFATVALSPPHLLGRSFLIRNCIPCAVHTGNDRYHQPRLPGVSTLRHSRFGRLFHPVTVSFAGRIRSLLGKLLHWLIIIDRLAHV
jgi:hypothetical protein